MAYYARIEDNPKVKIEMERISQTEELRKPFERADAVYQELKRFHSLHHLDLDLYTVEGVQDLLYYVNEYCLIVPDKLLEHDGAVLATRIATISAERHSLEAVLGPEMVAIMAQKHSISGQVLCVSLTGYNWIVFWRNRLEKERSIWNQPKCMLLVVLLVISIFFPPLLLICPLAFCCVGYSFIGTRYHDQYGKFNVIFGCIGLCFVVPILAWVGIFVGYYLFMVSRAFA